VEVKTTAWLPTADEIKSEEIIALRRRVLSLLEVQAMTERLHTWVEAEYLEVGVLLQTIVDRARDEDGIALGDWREDEYFAAYAEAVGLSTPGG